MVPTILVIFAEYGIANRFSGPDEDAFGRFSRLLFSRYHQLS